MRQSTLPTGAASGSPGPSGVVKTRKTTIKSIAHGGTYERPAFQGQRLSPRLNPTVGGDGTTSSHSIVPDATPIKYNGKARMRP